MIPIQSVTIVSSGGTPMQLADQRGAPYPTTGYGALVYNIGPYLIDAVFENATFTPAVFALVNHTHIQDHITDLPHITVDSTPPQSPDVNDIWIDTN